MYISLLYVILVANPCYARNVWGGVHFPPKSGVELGAAVTLICSDCSPTLQWLQSTPPPESGVAVKLMCSDCSQTPPPRIRSCSEVDVQWLQSNFAVTAVKPPHQNQELQWSWCAVTAVQLCSDCSRTPPRTLQNWKLSNFKYIDYLNSKVETFVGYKSKPLNAVVIF